MKLTSASPLAGLLGGLDEERRPTYAALASRIRLLVADGRLALGARLPAERELAEALGLSRATVSAAYAQLREDGWANARQGAGTWTAVPGSAERGAWVPAPAEAGVIDLAHAAPSAPPAVGAAFAAALEDLPRLLPGHGYHPEGLPDLRSRVAERYSARGLPTTSEQVFITAGALQGVALALEALTRRGQRLLVEQPTYPNALDLARDKGLRLVPVAVPDGDPGEFVATVARTAAATSASVAYLMPDFQNPTGQLLDAAERAGIARGLRRAGTVALVDETLVDTAIDTPAPAPQAAADPARTVTVGSLSKSVWGGLRVGWLRAEADLVRTVARVALRTQMSGPVVEQLAACHLLDALDDSLATRRAGVRERRDRFHHALAEHLPSWEVSLPAGGLVLWCRLPSARSSALAAAAGRRGLRLAAGPRFGTGHALDDRLRLPFTRPAEELVRAALILAELDAEMGPSNTREPGDPVPVY